MTRIIGNNDGPGGRRIVTHQMVLPDCNDANHRRPIPISVMQHRREGMESAPVENDVQHPLDVNLLRQLSRRYGPDTARSLENVLATLSRR
jgi:hypothetical protein